MTQHVLKKMARIHCARGPKRCEICREYASDLKWALLEINPDDNPMAARPVIEIDIDGEMVFMPFDVVAYFDDIKPAMEHVEKHKLKVDIIDS
jgi:hypothetical protein